MTYEVTLPTTEEPADAGPDWYPEERIVGAVEAENDHLALRKARSLYGSEAALTGGTE